MSVLPEIDFDETEIDTSEISYSSLTYRFDFDTGEITKRINGLEAIEQFIQKALNTIRFAHVIYSTDYGCEITDLFGQGFSGSFVKAEIIRTITEALIYDDRIDNVYDFKITSEGDSVYVDFKVDTVEGIIDISRSFSYTA